MSKRPYTGNKDGAAKGLRPGMKVFIDETIKLSNGALWNNGDFGVRPMRGKESMSVHGTGRAVDLSFRHMPPKKGVKNGRLEAMRVLKIIVANADALGLEAAFDYIVKPHGRAWMCRPQCVGELQEGNYSRGGSGDWLHFEVSPEMADSAEKMRKAFAQLVIPSPEPQAEEPKPA